MLFWSCDLSLFSIATTSVGEEKANLSVFFFFFFFFFCMLVRFLLLCFCLFPLPFGVREGLRLVIAALLGLLLLSVLSKYQWIFTKLGTCLDIVDKRLGIDNGHIGKFDIVTCPRYVNK